MVDKDPRMMMRYASMLVHRMQDVAKQYPAEEVNAFLVRATSLLNAEAALDPSVEIEPLQDIIDSIRHNKRKKM